jgi:hypothetical protein
MHHLIDDILELSLSKPATSLRNANGKSFFFNRRCFYKSFIESREYQIKLKNEVPKKRLSAPIRRRLEQMLTNLTQRRKV